MNAFDTEITKWLNSDLGGFGPLDWMMKMLASDYLVPPLFALAIIGVIFIGRNPDERFRYQRLAFKAVIAIAMTNWVLAILNGQFDRDRPYVALPDDIELMFYPATDPSFPANPTAVGFAVAVALFPVSRKLSIGLAAAALVVGFSRVYAGVFFPTDVMGAAVLGAAMPWVAGGIIRLFDPVLNLALRVARAFAVA
ncbi:MAG: phosphatase PAP2 family protein [Chloroflexi bacterium]|nr:phosphatase PAP2 family protein [Chloroflexota bacterium]